MSIFDRNEAAFYFKKAADREDIEASAAYALMAYHGEGTAPNQKEAADYYQKASNNDEPNSLLNLGWMLQIGEGIENCLCQLSKNSSLHNFQL